MNLPQTVQEIEDTAITDLFRSFHSKIQFYLKMLQRQKSHRVTLGRCHNYCCVRKFVISFQHQLHYSHYFERQFMYEILNTRR